MFASRFGVLKSKNVIRSTAKLPSGGGTTPDLDYQNSDDGHVAAATPAEGLQCPVCDNRMLVEAESALPPFGGVDFTLRSMKCDDCGMTSGLAFHPAIGYDREVTAAMRLKT